jgi:hypothetical protein
MVAMAIVVAALVLVVSGGVALRVKANRRLAQPWLNGVPLPAWDDSRWKHGYRNARLGAFVAQLEYGDLFDYGVITVDGTQVGVWSRYVRRVVKRTRQAERAAELEALLTKALAELEKP